MVSISGPSGEAFIVETSSPLLYNDFASTRLFTAYDAIAHKPNPTQDNSISSA